MCAYFHLNYIQNLTNLSCGFALSVWFFGLIPKMYLSLNCKFIKFMPHGWKEILIACIDGLSYANSFIHSPLPDTQIAY